MRGSIKDAAELLCSKHQSLLPSFPDAATANKLFLPSLQLTLLWRDRFLN
jgi:hypothetical protein